MVESIDSRSRKLDVSNAIEAVTINEFKSIIYDHKGAAFSKFLLLAVGIEYLGACLDDFPFDEPKESENRFNKSLKKLFPKSYGEFAKKSAKVYLFEEFRCPFVHQLRPGKKISLTHRLESKKEGTSHLHYIKNGGLVLVLEDLFDDFEKASKKLINDFKTGKVTNKKGEANFLVVTSIRNNE